MSFVLLSKVAKQRERSTPKKYTQKKYTLDTPAAESHSVMTAKRTFLCTKFGTLDRQYFQAQSNIVRLTEPIRLAYCRYVFIFNFNTLTKKYWRIQGGLGSPPPLPPYWSQNREKRPKPRKGKKLFFESGLLPYSRSGSATETLYISLLTTYHTRGGRVFDKLNSFVKAFNSLFQGNGTLFDFQLSSSEF